MACKAAVLRSPFINEADDVIMQKVYNWTALADALCETGLSISYVSRESLSVMNASWLSSVPALNLARNGRRPTSLRSSNPGSFLQFSSVISLTRWRLWSKLVRVER